MDVLRPTDPSQPTADGLLRRAGSGDVPAFLRLREVMLRDVNGEQDAQRAWSDATVDWLHTSLADPNSFAAFVVDEPGRGVVSIAAGRTVPWMPSPRNPTGLTGHVFNVATDVDRRHRGYARRCMEALLGWFRDDTPVTRVELHASIYGIDLYRSLGFEPPREPALRLSIER
jgi:ribosomal protein S18 acetylase RimI-like enzyme